MQGSGDLPFNGGTGYACGIGGLQYGRGLFGQTEIEQLDPLFCNQDVGWLEVAMDDAFPVCGFQGLEYLESVRQRN